MARTPASDEEMHDITRELLATTKAYRDGIRQINTKITETLAPFKERVAEGGSARFNEGEAMLIRFISDIVDIIGATVEQVEKAQNERG